MDDIIDISDLLSGYDPLNDAISDFIALNELDNHTILAVDPDGRSGNQVVQNIARLSDITNEWIDINDMINQGNLII